MNLGVDGHPNPGLVQHFCALGVPVFQVSLCAEASYILKIFEDARHGAIELDAVHW